MHCPGCGAPSAECGGCLPELDPPHFCRDCGRRLTVRVSPGGWRARCNRCQVDLAGVGPLAG